MEGRLAHYFFGLKDEIESNSDDLAIGAIHEIRQNLDSLILRLNNIHNSKLGINKLPLDILYKFFALSAYDSDIPERTALNVSHVCERWRILALGSPTLWAFVDLNNSISLIDLFIRRSEKAPLALSWRNGWPRRCTNFDQLPSQSYFLVHANSILSRLWFLQIHSSYTDFTRFYHIIHSSGLPLLQLRHLDISLTGDFKDVRFEEQPQLMDSVNTLHLYEICLIGLDFVWLELTHNQLTHFTLAYPINPPSLSQLLIFLSNCPVLQILDLTFRDNNQTETIPSSQGPAPMVNGLVLNLTTLRLEANGPSSYGFIRRFSKHIRLSKALSQFELNCEKGTNIAMDGLLPFSIFEAVPSGIFSRLPNLVYLNVHLLECTGFLALCADSAVDAANSRHWNCCSCSLIIRCRGFLIDKSIILELMQSMPQISYLALRAEAWRSFTPKSVDMRSLFPSFRSLEVDNWSVLKSLPTSLGPKELILYLWFDLWPGKELDVLTDFVLERGVEVLVIIGDLDPQLSEAASNLREKGVSVILKRDD